jgi:hypothetical protein
MNLQQHGNLTSVYRSESSEDGLDDKLCRSLLLPEIKCDYRN